MTRVRPILFSGAMVRKILSGDKTQTRRIAQNMYDKAFIEGDVLWVRETWKLFTDDNEDTRVIFRANVARPEPFAWKPSIHMPKSHSRLTLSDIAVRIEPLHDISEVDARAEGVSNVAEYKDLWDKLNAERMPWRANPLVFVIDFKPHEDNVERYIKRQAA